MPKDQGPFVFDISLSVLNHLGRNLYRNFITILGEAISNAWDANATNVWIDFDQKNSTLVIKDDGDGMDADDFQNRFLKIGYSKRNDLKSDKSSKGRPFIGRKGIGKLALLSCSELVSVATKTEGEGYVGGTINNPNLDNAIEKNTSSYKYPLGDLDLTPYKEYTQNHEKGTIIYFSNLKEGISSSEDQIKKQIALYFRFSLIDPSFTIYINNNKIGIHDLDGLIDTTEFLWELNENKDPFVDALSSRVIEKKPILQLPDVHGFIASVKKPADLKIYGTGGHKIGIDLFVNGRLREANIMSHIPTARIPENYMYGQIHYDRLDIGDDRFNTSRETIKADDELFNAMLEHIKGILVGKNGIFDQWDDLRLKNKKEGDDDNGRKTKRERASAKLFNETINDFRDTDNEEVKSEVDQWSDELANDAQYNIDAYADCFVSENIVRKYVKEMDNPNIAPQQTEIDKWREREIRGKRKGNLSIGIRLDEDDLYYLDLEHLAEVAQPAAPGDGYPDRLIHDEKEFTPIRNAVMHTSLLTPEAKTKLRTVRDNIRAKIRLLLDKGS